MRIEQFEYTNRDTGWKLSSTTLFPDLTLLVGVSGVGKTRILKALRSLKNIARRDTPQTSYWGVAWRLQFATSGKRYTWEGEYESRPTSDNDPLGLQPDEDEDFVDTITDSETSKRGPKLLREHLSDDSDSKTIIARDSKDMFFNGVKTPRLSPFISAISLLNEEDIIRPVFNGFGNIAYMDQTAPPAGSMVTKFETLCTKHGNISKLQQCDLPLYIKMAILHEVDKPSFNNIIKQFRAVFPIVEEVRFIRVSIGPFTDIPDLRIKEVGVDQWIPESQMSSGMFRTLMHLGSVVLWPDESVILIDEFENSLGINCLDEVTGDMMSHRHHLQFIVTSHHPYIINNIPSKHWKIVARRAAEVRTIDASEAGIGKSHHEAFIQLINSSLYQDGVTTK